MTTLFARVLEMSLTAAAVIAAILIIRLPLRKAPRKYSYLLWSAAAFRLMCPVSFRAKFSIFRLGRTAGGTAALFDPSPAVSALPGGFSAGTAVEPAVPFEPKYVLSYPAVSPITTPDPDVPALRRCDLADRRGGTGHLRDRQLCPPVSAYVHRCTAGRQRLAVRPGAFPVYSGTAPPEDLHSLRSGGGAAPLCAGSRKISSEAP